MLRAGMAAEVVPPCFSHNTMGRKMFLSQAFQAAATLVKIHVMKKRIPLFVSWNITFRCNLRCVYCAACEAPRRELETKEVLDGLDTLWALGTRWITFGGGEPLLREDMGEIVRAAKAKGFNVFMSTNGVLVPSRKEVVACLDHVNLSMDGNRKVHDTVRGEGTFDKALKAADICRELGIPVSLQCVLSKYNLNALEDALAIARQYGVNVMFQPATRWLSSSTKTNPIAPDTEPYREAIGRLIELKRKGEPIRNSITGLRHLAHWPDPTKIWCVGGILISIVEADGTVLACHQCQVSQFLTGQASRPSVKDGFAAMTMPKGCVQCWCAPLVELAFLFSLRPEAVWNAIRTGR